MSVQVEKLEKNMAKLTIEVAAEELDKAMDSVYKKTRGRINVPGFRKGKAPRKMIERMYGTGIFLEDAVNELIPAQYSKAVEECGEEITSQPKIDLVQAEPGKALIFTAEVALRPEVTLGAYKGVEVPKSDTAVTEDEINDAIKVEQRKNSRKVTVEDRAAEKEDTVTLDYTGSVDGVEFEGGKGTDYPLVLGSGSFIPGFEDQLVGVKTGDHVEVKVTFPEDYHAEELKGKEAVFQCDIKKVETTELPELDDDFAQDVSEFDTFAEYREDVAKTVAERKEKAARQAKEDAAVDKAIENAQMEIPDAMVDTQARQMVEDYARNMQAQGISMDQYLQYTGMTVDQLVEQTKPEALKRIQSRLVLEAIADAEAIEVTEDDLAEEFQKLADAYKMEVEKVRSYYGDAQIEQMKKDLAVQKAITLLADEAVETE